MSSSPSITPPSPTSIPEEKVDKTPVMLKRLPAPISNLLLSTQDKAYSLLPFLRSNPLTRVSEWAENKLKKYLPFLFSEKKSEGAVAQPAVPSPVPPSSAPASEQISTSAPQHTPEPFPPPTAAKPDSEDFQKAAEAEQKKMGLIMADFEAISGQLRSEMKRSGALDSLAAERMRAMKETRVLSHDGRKGPENILSGKYDSAEEVAKKFMASPEHRPNMLGSYKKFGLAMDRVFAKEENKETGKIEEKWQYFFVVVFDEGEPADPLPAEQNIPSVQNSAASVDTFFPAMTALEASAKEAGLEIAHEPDAELTQKWVSEAERGKGTVVETFQTADGKKVNYIVRKNPPTLTQLGDRGRMSQEMLFSEFLEHFKKAISVPSANELQQQVDMPSAPEATYGMEKEAQHEEPAIVNPS